MDTVNPVLDYYSEAASMTLGGKHARRLTSLPERIDALCKCVQKLFIYDVVAKDFYGYGIPKNRLGEIHLRSTASLLDKIVLRSDEPLTEPRDVKKRVIGRCNHFVLLAVAALRAHEMPARARSGFGAYFNPPKYEDHWVCEYWDARKGQWSFADVQFDQVWIDKLHIRHNVADVPRDQFLTAGEAWKVCRARKLDPELFGIEFAKLRGLWFIAASLIRDAAALNKVEMLPWDSWGAQPQLNAALGPDELAFFDELAELAANPDRTLDELRNRYDTDARVQVPDKVLNLLRQRMEPVGVQVARSATGARGAEPESTPSSAR